MSPEERDRLLAMATHEKRLKELGFSYVFGVDEAGRGPLAGPVVAAACMLPEGAFFEGLNDSKQLSSADRARLFQQITQHPGVIYGVAQASVAEIDRYNILKATFLAMRRAVRLCRLEPDYLLIDGNQLPRIEFPAEALVEGDAHSVSIAAASILAKETRDRMMKEFHQKWPRYGFQQHKGYGTPEHLEALERWGPCPLHRKSFDPVKSYFSDRQTSFLDASPDLQ